MELGSGFTWSLGKFNQVGAGGLGGGLGLELLDEVGLHGVPVLSIDLVIFHRCPPGESVIAEYHVELLALLLRGLPLGDVGRVLEPGDEVPGVDGVPSGDAVEGWEVRRPPDAIMMQKCVLRMLLGGGDWLLVHLVSSGLKPRSG